MSALSLIGIQLQGNIIYHVKSKFLISAPPALRTDLEALASMQSDRLTVLHNLSSLLKVESRVVQRFCEILGEFNEQFEAELGYLIVVFNVQNGR